jgi:hypothetical protein
LVSHLLFLLSIQQKLKKIKGTLRDLKKNIVLTEKLKEYKLKKKKKKRD